MAGSGKDGHQNECKGYGYKRFHDRQPLSDYKLNLIAPAHMTDAKMAGREEGREEGILNERTAMAMRMLERGKYSYEEISEMSKLTVGEVQALDEKRKNQ